MELSDIVIAASSASVIFALGANAKAFLDTKKWLSNHTNSIWWNERRYHEDTQRSLQGFLCYYTSYPGRQIAYRLYSQDNGKL